jgi:hypothetical protein
MRTLAESIALYEAAELQILSGQEYELDGQRLRMPDLKQVQAALESLRKRLSAETAATNRVPTLGGMVMKQASFGP